MVAFTDGEFPIYLSDLKKSVRKKLIEFLGLDGDYPDIAIVVIRK